jgi:hypothetical protein
LHETRTFNSKYTLFKILFSFPDSMVEESSVIEAKANHLNLEHMCQKALVQWILKDSKRLLEVTQRLPSLLLEPVLNATLRGIELETIDQFCAQAKIQTEVVQAHSIVLDDDDEDRPREIGIDGECIEFTDEVIESARKKMRFQYLEQDALCLNSC